jgi:hypothetical protein
MSKPSRDVIVDFAIECCESDCYDGLCLACGNVQDCCEPDARRYKCEACGERNVYAGQELLIMYAG